MKLFEKLKNIKEHTKEWFFSWKMKKDYYREQKNNIDKDLSSKKGNGQRDIKVYRRSKKAKYLKLVKSPKTE